MDTKRIEELKLLKVQVNEVVQQVDSNFNPKRTICIPVDESENSKYVVDWTIQKLLNSETDQVVLLNVRPIPVDSYLMESEFPYLLPSETINKMDETAKEYSHQLLKKYGRIYQTNGIHCRAVALRGDTRQELELKIEKIHPDLVIIGTRGLGLIKRALLGSVSEHLIHHLKVPVLTVPLNDTVKTKSE